MPDLQSEVKAGDRVTITLPDGSTTPGTVTSVGKVATRPAPADSGGRTAGRRCRCTIRPTDPTATGSLDQAPVEVAITDQTVPSVLAVPVVALLALVRRRLRRRGRRSATARTTSCAVTTGLFDDAAGHGAGDRARDRRPARRVVVPRPHDASADAGLGCWRSTVTKAYPERPTGGGAPRT